MTHGTRSAIVVGAFAAFDAGLAVIELPPVEPLVTMGALALLSAQAGLTAVWLVLGRRPAWPVRLSVSLVVPPALATVLAAAADEWTSYWPLFLSFGTQLVMVVLALTSLDIFAFECVDEGRADAAQPADNARSQITIRDLLVLTAAFGVAAAAAVYGSGNLVPLDLPSLIIFGSWLAAVTVIAAVAALACKRVALPAVVAIAAAAGCGYSLARTLNQPADLWYFTGMAAIAAAVQFAVLAGYRHGGQRWKWRRRVALATEVPDEVRGVT